MLVVIVVMVTVFVSAAGVVVMVVWRIRCRCGQQHGGSDACFLDATARTALAAQLHTHTHGYGMYLVLVRYLCVYIGTVANLSFSVGIKMTEPTARKSQTNPSHHITHTRTHLPSKGARRVEASRTVWKSAGHRCVAWTHCVRVVAMCDSHLAA